MMLSIRVIIESSFSFFCLIFFFNDTATTEIYTLSLHDALPIYSLGHRCANHAADERVRRARGNRSEEHTSELQSREELVCRLLLEKKKEQEHPQAAIAVSGCADRGRRLADRA